MSETWPSLLAAGGLLFLGVLVAAAAVAILERLDR